MRLRDRFSLLEFIRGSKIIFIRHEFMMHNCYIANETQKGNEMEIEKMNNAQLFAVVERALESPRALNQLFCSLGINPTRSLPRTPSVEQIRAEDMAAKAKASAKITADADAELRLEVVAELIAEGKAPHVAANLTNTKAKLLSEARRVGIL